MARAEAETKTQARALSRLRERLDEWRKGSAPGVAIPSKLWAAAGRMARGHGVYVTACALGLEYNKLKRASGGVIAQVRGEGMRPPKAQPMKFIEVSGVVSASSSGCRVSLQGPEGQRVQLEMAPSAATEVVLQLCRWGWSAHP